MRTDHSAVGCVYTAELRNGKEVFARPGPESGAVTHHPLRNPTGQACRDAVGEMGFGWLEAPRRRFRAITGVSPFANSVECHMLRGLGDG